MAETKEQLVAALAGWQWVNLPVFQEWGIKKNNKEESMKNGEEVQDQQRWFCGLFSFPSKKITLTDKIPELREISSFLK